MREKKGRREKGEIEGERGRERRREREGESEKVRNRSGGRHRVSFRP